MADNPQEQKPSIATDEQKSDVAAQSTENSLVSRIQRRLQTKQGSEGTATPKSIARVGLNDAATHTRLSRVQRAADRSTVWHPDAGAAPSMITRFADTIVERFPDKSGKYQVQRQAPKAEASSSFVFASHGNAAQPAAAVEEDTAEVEPQQISLEEIRRKISERSVAREQSAPAPQAPQTEMARSQPSQPAAVQTQPSQPAVPATIRRRPLSRVEEVTRKPATSPAIGRSVSTGTSPVISRAATSEGEEQTEAVVRRQVAPPVTLGGSSAEEEGAPEIQTKPMVARAAVPPDEENETPMAVQPKPLVSRAAASEEPEQQVAPKRIARAAAEAQEETVAQTKPLVSRAAAPVEEAPEEEKKASPPLATAASFFPTKTSDDDKASPAIQRKTSSETTSSLPLINRSTDLPLTAKAQRSPLIQRAATTPSDASPLLLHQPVQKQAARQPISRQSMPVAQRVAQQTQASGGNAQRSPEMLAKAETVATSNDQEGTQMPLASVSRSPMMQRQSTTVNNQAVLHREEKATESAGAGNTPAPTPEAPKEALDLDKLARDVYPIIKRMFAIERERSHSRY